MEAALLIAIINFATKFGIEASIALARGISKPNVSIDEAIAALDAASKKTAQDYLNEAKAELTGVGTT